MDMQTVTASDVSQAKATIRAYFLLVESEKMTQTLTEQKQTHTYRMNLWLEGGKMVGIDWELGIDMYNYIK